MITAKAARYSMLVLFYAPPLLLGCYLLLMCLYIMLTRYSYPYELEWIESAMFQVAMRVVHGLPIYTAPNMEYVPPLYTPLYFYVSAFALKIFGVGLPALRIVSLVASLGTAVLVACLIWRLTRSVLSVFLGFCCWSAVYSLSGTYYDLARVDSLWTFFLTAAVTSMVCYLNNKKPVLLVLLVCSLVLAVFTKQTTLALIPFFFAALWCWSSLSVALVCGTAWLMIVSVVLLILQSDSGGLFYFYTMEMARGHHFNPGIPKNFLLGDMLFGVPVYLLLVVVFFANCKNGWRRLLGWGLLFFGYFLMSMLARWYSGGWFNVLIPFHQLIVVISVVGSWYLFCRLQVVQHSIVKYGLVGLSSVLLTLNMARGWIQPHYSLPTVADRACGDKLVSMIAHQSASRVCISRHPYLATLAGKQDCAHEALAVDVLNGDDQSLAVHLKEDTQRKLMSGFYPLLLQDNDGQFSGYDVLWKNMHYTATDIDVCAADVFFPKVSGQRPRHWLVYNGKQMEDQRFSH